MKDQYHILNGDVLKDQFPENILGEIIIARECLMDGPVDGNTLDELYITRANFLNENFGKCSHEDYLKKSAIEFQKAQSIPSEASINLWFEDDLFCQVNLWFIIKLISDSQNNNDVYLIRPNAQNPYNFGNLCKTELVAAYHNRSLLADLDLLADLWTFYQQGKVEKLLLAAKALEGQYPFILPAVIAHIERVPSNGDLGRPRRVLLQLMKEFDTAQFDVIFKEFSKRESIYGFGDSQVERMFDELKYELNDSEGH